MTSEAHPAGDRAEASPYSKHVPALDGVRGLAILMVMASHLFPGTPHNLGERFLVDTFEFGASGVDLFFVLSGFLITGILFDSRQDRFFFRKFYARRALRIFPLYYGVLAVFALVGFAMSQDSGGELASLALYLQNTPLLAAPIWRYRGALELPVGHFWSLAVEEQFYLVWPLLVFWLNTRRRLLAVCVLSVFVCPLARFLLWIHGFSYAAVNASTFCRADVLLLGGALALLLRSQHRDRVLPVARWLAIGIVPVLVLRYVNSAAGVVIKGTTALGVWSLLYTVLAFGYVGLLSCALAPHSRAQAFFEWSPLRMLGRYSYGLYVLHLIVLYYGQAPLRSFVQHSRIASSLISPVTGGVVFFASLATAMLSYRLYEKPFLELKRFFEYKTERQAVVPARSDRLEFRNEQSGRDRLPTKVAESMR